MLRAQVASLMRHNTRRTFILALTNNLHTSQISAGRNKLKRNKNAQVIPVAVILCGCGRLDGTEISEAISVAINLRQNNMKAEFYAPNIDYTSVDHLTKKTDAACPKRNALVESARLARTCCKSLCECEACTHGGLLIPGGFGAARTLSNFIEKGAQCTVLPDLEQLIEDFYCAKKPIGTMCIASAIVARVLKGVTVTLGKDTPKERWPHAALMKSVKEMDAKLEMKDVTEIAVDKEHKVCSTPAWLCEQATYAEVHEGIGKLVVMLKNCMNK